MFSGRQQCSSRTRIKIAQADMLHWRQVSGTIVTEVMILDKVTKIARWLAYIS